MRASCWHSSSLSSEQHAWRHSVEFQCASLTSLYLIRRLPHDLWPELIHLVPRGASEASSKRVEGAEQTL